MKYSISGEFKTLSLFVSSVKQGNGEWEMR